MEEESSVESSAAEDLSAEDLSAAESVVVVGLVGDSEEEVEVVEVVLPTHMHHSQ